MSASKINSSDCLKVRQTMFEFLKRKKQNELEKSIRDFNDSSKKPHQIGRSSSHHKNPIHSRAKSSSIYDDLVIEEHDTIPLVSLKKNRYNNTASITPRKITFAVDQIEDKPQSSRKPLLQMISPKKNINRSSTKNIESLYKNSKEKQKQRSNPRKSILKSNILRKNNSQPFSKKQLNVSLENFKQTFQRMFDAGQIAREKNSQLSIALVNFVKDLDKNRGKENFSVDKKLGEIRYILNAIDSSLEIFKDPVQAQQIIEQFHKNLSQNLNEIQSCSNHNMKSQYQQEIIKITTQKQSLINELDDRNHKLEREIEKLNKLIEKMQKEYEAQLGHQAERQQNFLQTIENLKLQRQQRQQTLMEKVELLQRQLEEERTSHKQLQKQLKDVLYRQEKSISQEQSKQAEESLVRQTYLLQQIQNLRHTFNTDISQLQKLYETKQLQFEKKLQKLTQELQNEKYERKCDRQVADRILNEANASRNDALKLGKKNQELLQDLYRINEDLFQHWLALKDVKTLSERLHIFQHFERIYLDLAFNPKLFSI